MKKLRVLDLFSGIGGFSLGLERTGGFETVAFCEIEKFPRKVLRKHWPEVPIHEDVRKLKGEDIGAVDVICGGYPCQPFSTAGQRRGAEDDRHLWPEFNRLVAELRPTWVIGENVAGHISMGLDDVLSDLEGQGYACRTFVIPAVAVDAPHRRDRVWTVANRESGGPQGGSKSAGCSEIIRQRFQSKPSRNGDSNCRGPLANTNNERLQRRQEARDAGSIRKGRDKLAERCGDYQGSAWCLEPDVGRVAARLSDELDRGGLNDKLGGAQGSAESCGPEWEDLRGVRRVGKPTAPPSRLQQADRSNGAVSDLPRSGRHCRWDAQNPQDEALQAVWRTIHADTQQAAQSLWPGVPVGNGPDQRFETLEWGPEPNVSRVAFGVKERVDRLKALGNAVVPQIPEMIGRAIMEAEGIPCIPGHTC